MQSLISKNLEVLIFDDPIDEYAFSKIKNYEKFLTQHAYYLAKK
jgi:HSP90 family molecular chaperone